MKITKLIIPLLGLTSINNANKELLQIEKTPEISYEVVASDKWDNYYLTNNDTIENIAYSQQDKNDLSGDLVCLDLLNAANACWDDWNPVRATACYSVAWALYLACVAGTTGF